MIKCNSCGYNQYISLHNYLQKSKTYSTLIDNNKYCNAHKEINIKYCITCNIYLCNQCNTHKSHQLTLLDNIISTNHITNHIKEGYNHINLYCNQLKNYKINYYINQINHLEYSYQSFRTINNNILNMIHHINNNYNNNHYNYFFRENINNFLNKYRIKLEKCLNDNELINYYNNYNILKIDINYINNIKTIDKHRNWVYSLILLQDGRLASCSGDKSINIYDMNNNYNCDITIKGHTDRVTYISQLENNKLISCSWDKSLKIWTMNKSSYQLDYTIENAHNEIIWKVIPLTNNRIASCSNDKTIKIWNGNYPYNLIKIMEGHSDTTRSIIQLKDKNILISGSNDNTLRKWNLSTYQCDKIISNVSCYRSNSLLQIDNNRVVVGYNKIITIVNIINDTIEYQIENNQLLSVESFMILRDGNILCGDSKGLICIYDIQLNTLIFKNDKIHDKEISCLLNINKDQFISCSWDKTIKVWEY